MHFKGKTGEPTSSKRKGVKRKSEQKAKDKKVLPKKKKGGKKKDESDSSLDEYGRFHYHILPIFSR